MGVSAPSLHRESTDSLIDIIYRVFQCSWQVQISARTEHAQCAGFGAGRRGWVGSVTLARLIHIIPT